MIRCPTSNAGLNRANGFFAASIGHRQTDRSISERVGHPCIAKTRDQVLELSRIIFEVFVGFDRRTPLDYPRHPESSWAKHVVHVARQRRTETKKFRHTRQHLSDGQDWRQSIMAHKWLSFSIVGGNVIHAFDRFRPGA
jgi:hypothetical protein